MKIDYSYAAYLRRHYFFEFERKRDFNSASTITVGVVSLVAAAIFKSLQNFGDAATWLGSLRMVSLFCASLASAFAIFFLIRSHLGHEYKFSGSTDLLDASRQTAAENEMTRNDIDIATSDHVLAAYAASIAFNEATNDKKSGYLSLANTSLVWAIASLVLYAGLTSVQYVRVAVEGDSTLAENDAPKDHREERPKLPNPPPERVIKENSVPKPSKR